MSNKQQSTSRKPWSRRSKLIVSALVAFHVAAVFMAPFRFSTTAGPGAPVSPFAQSLMWCFDWYVQAMYLDHGYAFFAPDPGPSHLIRYELYYDDREEPVVKYFPDIERHWPRLLYHRHFMLSEQLNMQFMPVNPPPEMRGDPQAEAAWAADRMPYQQKWDAFQAHLKKTYGADHVVMTRVQHGLATVPEVLQGKELNDPSLYRDLSETEPDTVPDDRNAQMRGPLQ